MQGGGHGGSAAATQLRVGVATPAAELEGILTCSSATGRNWGKAEINAALSHLATEERVSTSTQNQALAALLCLYRHVLGSDVGSLEGVIRARRKQRLPVVLTVETVRAVLKHLEGTEALVAQLLYGAGLRLMEALRLRIQDVDLEQRGVCTKPISLRGGAQWSCPMPWKGHTRMPQGNGPGNGCFHSADAGGIHAGASKGDTIWTQPCAACRTRGGAGGEDQQTGHLPHLPPFLRHA
ncbi:phage integrase N-terminal SAM-like domain-containing protein [Cyanobium sp. ATX 6A2]|uniref:phage integrase N-terminal SAM-like domain-containing protein n=1 Tax=Cyanobium sp. ATX 6A2 TaxID=2823700 RepID=UPI0020CEF1BF|nr:phage integrase N-terminal SAM-like domain-containing protein [Cyanobium sp. ATX 6A2]